MLILPKNHYHILLEPVLKIPFNMLMARSVISDHADGTIYVDSLENPHTFYIIHPYGMSFLCGCGYNLDFNNDLLDYFTQRSFPRKKAEWLQAFPRDWDDFMNPLVEQGIILPSRRLNFKFDVRRFYETYKQMDTISFSGEIISTPTEMLFEIDGTVVPKDYWKSPEQFASMAKAFTVMIDGKPASTAFTSARHDDKLEIGIETKPEYHGKGLGYIACAKLIEYCLEHQLEPVWSCRLDNIGSVKLSQKLGFVETLNMPYYHIPM